MWIGGKANFEWLLGSFLARSGWMKLGVEDEAMMSFQG